MFFSTCDVSTSSTSCNLPVITTSSAYAIIWLHLSNMVPRVSTPSCSSCSYDLWRWDRQSVPKRRLIKFQRRGITQKKEYNTLDLLIAISNTILNNKGAIASPVLKPFFFLTLNSENECLPILTLEYISLFKILHNLTNFFGKPSQ